MALRYRIPLPGPFCYSGRVGPRHWIPRSSSSGCGPMGFIVKWLIIYPSVVIFGVGMALLFAPFYGVFWVVRRSLRNRRKCQPVAQCFPVRQPLSQWSLSQLSAARPVSRSYGFVPDRRPVQPVSYGFVSAQWPVGAPAYALPPGVPRGWPERGARSLWPGWFLLLGWCCGRRLVIVRATDTTMCAPYHHPPFLVFWAWWVGVSEPNTP